MAHDEDALSRRYLDRALAEVERHVCKQTGFIHTPEQMIPCYENALYALLLLRRRTVESIQAAKGLLRKILAYQNRDETADQYGNFPLFLSDFPLTVDWAQPLRLSFVCTVVVSRFFTILGDELNTLLRSSIDLLRLCSSRNQQKMTPPAAMSLWYALQGSEGVDVDRWVREMISGTEPLFPSSLGLSMVVAWNRGQAFPVDGRYWHAQSQMYSGPALGVFHEGGGAEVTLFDVAMSLSQGEPPPERRWSCQAALETALIPPDYHVVEPMEYRQRGVQIFVIGSVTIAALLQRPKAPFGFCPLRVVTPNGAIAVHFPSGELVGCCQSGGRIVCTIREHTLSEENPELLCAYIPRDHNHTIHVQSGPATTFDPTPGVHISSGNVVVALSVPVPNAIGTRRLGNRPGQRNAKKPEDRVAYDAVVSVEWLRGHLESWTCSLEVLEGGSNPEST